MLGSDKFREALETIKASNNILITAHIRPDGDACGSVRGITYLAEVLGKKIHPLFLSQVSDWHNFLFEEEPDILGHSTAIEDLKEGLGKWADIDLVVICDTNSYTQLPIFEEWLRGYKKQGKKVLVFDHHITNDSIGDVELVDASSAACGEIVFEFLKFAQIKIPADVAEALFVSIASDTGWFRFGAKANEVYSRASELITLGASPVTIYQRLYQNFELPRLKLLARVLDGLELHLDKRVAVKTILQKDLIETNASPRDTQGIIEQGQKIGSVRVAVVLVEQEDSKIKVSLRSKGEVNVRKIAQKFGGGGHDFAAGVIIDSGIEEAKAMILEEIKKQFDAL